MTAPIVAVTGANRGLGLALAKELATQGAKVVLLCRDPARAEAAQHAVAAVSAGPEPTFVIADLADLASVRAAAGELADAVDGLDALVNNASVFTATRTETIDGLETMFATNHLGPFLLTTLVLPLLQANAGRVLTLSAPSTVALDFDDLQSERSFKALRAFGASKMANLLFTYELARRASPLGITANAIHPGLVRTDLMRAAPAPLRWATRIVSRPPDQAAASLAPIVLAADDPVTGELLKAGKPVTTNDFSRDPANQTRLWDISEALTNDQSGAHRS